MAKIKNFNDFALFANMMGSGNLFDFGSMSSIFGGIERKPDVYKQNDWTNLGDGYYLVPIADFGENRERYSHLYKDGQKLSDSYFRKGGMHFGWKGNYTMLIVYQKMPRKRTGKPPKKDEPKYSFDFGHHCVIDRSGNIVYTTTNALEYPCLIGGCLMSIKNSIINLIDGSKLIHYNGSMLSSDEFIFVENNYDSNYKYGVYKISKADGEIVLYEKNKK